MYHGSIPELVRTLEAAEWQPATPIASLVLDTWLDPTGTLHLNLSCIPGSDGELVRLSLPDVADRQDNFCPVCTDATVSDLWEPATEELRAAAHCAWALNQMDVLAAALDLIEGNHMGLRRDMARRLTVVITDTERACMPYQTTSYLAWLPGATAVIEAKWQALRRRMATLSPLLIAAWAEAMNTPDHVPGNAWQDCTPVLMASTVRVPDSSVLDMLADATLVRDGARILLLVPRYVADALLCSGQVSLGEYHRTMPAPDDAQVVATAAALWATATGGPLEDLYEAVVTAQRVLAEHSVPALALAR